MARPPVEWPIPVYVAELRERVVVSFRAPARVVRGKVPLPVTPELVGGQALVSLCLGNGRCLKPAGDARTLESEFHVAELVTPARWQGACRPTLRGIFLLHLLTDSHGLARLLRKALEWDSEPSRQTQGPEGDGYECRVGDRSGHGEAWLRLRRPIREESWPAASVYASQEEAEIHLLHPEWHFVPGRDGRVVHATPVHQYARSTISVGAQVEMASLVASALGARPDELTLDHVLFQKRCTHTWSFPPERILTARRAAPVLAPAPAGYRLPVAA
jgi:hypothetical protein